MKFVLPLEGFYLPLVYVLDGSKSDQPNYDMLFELN